MCNFVGATIRRPLAAIGRPYMGLLFFGRRVAAPTFMEYGMCYFVGATIRRPLAAIGRPYMGLLFFGRRVAAPTLINV